MEYWTLLKFKALSFTVNEMNVLKTKTKQLMTKEINNNYTNSLAVRCWEYVMHLYRVTEHKI